MTSTTTNTEKIRLDKWLWVARFFKTRKLALEAIQGGKIRVNGQKPKPSKEVKIDMMIEIHNASYQWNIKVLQLSKYRKSAKEAQYLYQETDDSVAKRQAQLDQRQQQAQAQPPEKRPNKKQRRQIHQLKREQSNG